MLWWPGSFTDTSDGYRVFCPNILEYHVPLVLIEQSQDIGVVWHTDLFGAGLFKSTDKIWSNHILYSTTPTEQWLQPNPEFDALITPTFTLVMKKFMMWMITSESKEYTIEQYYEWYDRVFIGWWYSNYTSDKKMKLLTEYETMMTEHNIHLVLYHLLRIIFLKNDYLRALNEQTPNINVFVTVDGVKEQVKHEGFVINSPYGSMKAVDRYQFSRLNRLDNITRGWQKDK